MNTGNFEPSMFLAILPEMGLVLLAGLILFLDLLWKGKDLRRLGYITAIGLTILAVLGLFFSLPSAKPVLIFGSMLRLDWMSFVFRMIFFFGAAVTALFILDEPGESRTGEFYALLITSTLGMSLMASSANLVMLYLAIELTSIPLYILTGFKVKNEKSVESGIKYFLYGAMTSAVMLYGFSLVYGFSGSANLYEIASNLQKGNLPPILLSLSAGLVMVGFGFKVSTVPFHFWAPDVYEGAPTAVAGFLSTASKAAGFAVLLRFMLAVFPSIQMEWTLIIAILATASMILGNILALAQKNIKRLLAYSSIAQAGYILVGVAADSPLGATGTIFYLTSYLVTNLAAFAIISYVGQRVGSDDLEAFAGLNRKNPTLALAMLIAVLSLGGIPPLSGFVGKLLVFAAAVQAGQIWLAFVGVITSIVGLYYYLVILKTIYARESAHEVQALPLNPAWKTALILCVAGIILLGTVFGPVYTWTNLAGSGLF